MKPIEHDQCVIDHYVKHFGLEPLTRHLYTRHDLPDAVPSPLNVLQFGPLSDHAYWVYATAGMSRKSMVLPSQDADTSGEIRGELLLYSDQSLEGIADSLAGIATYPFTNQTFLAEGHTIGGKLGRGVVPGSPITDILVAKPLYEEEDFEVIDLGDDCHAHVLWVLPIYPSERQYKIKHGFAALIDLFEQNEVDAIDSRRPPTV